MKKTKLLIIGGVAGGASAAARARRLSEKAEIILFERGPDISFANCGLPYHIGGTIAEREHLLITTPAQMEAKFNIEVRTSNEVTHIDSEKKMITVRNVANNEEYTESYDVLILSPGAAPARPPIPGIESRRVLSLRNMQDMDRIIKATKGKQQVAIIGGGYIGLEMAEAMRKRNIKTTLIEAASQVMGPADPEMVSPIQKELQLNGVDLKLETTVDAFEENENGIVLKLSNQQSLQVGIAVLAIGVKPEITLAQNAGLKLGTTGGIHVDDHMRTSDPSIYAVGDAVEVKDYMTKRPALIPLAGPANRQGRIAADNIFGRSSIYKETQGTAICKVFNLAIGMTGLSEKMAIRENIAYEKIYIHPLSHASYYPGAHALSLKLLFDPSNGKVLGAQAIGADGVDKRIDVIAVTIRAGLTVYDLEELELSYAPPYGSAKDPVNYAGFVATNILRKDASICHVEDMLEPSKDQVILDVREPDELDIGTIPKSIYIPLDELRKRINELTKDKEYLVFCQVGLRGYLACRILEQNGIKCKNLIGGYKSFTMATKPLSMEHQARNEQKMETKADHTPSVDITKEIDACGLQCPGPILQLKEAIGQIDDGKSIKIIATDHGFSADVAAWCNSTGNQLEEIKSSEKGYTAIITRGSAPAQQSTAIASGPKRFTNVVFSNDLDKAIAAFIIANGAVAMGYEVTLFFTFWGLNVLRKKEPVVVKKNLIEKMFGIMMPRGPEKLKLSQMHMGGMGAAMIKGIMKKKNVLSLPELIKTAQDNGVRIVACSMSMDLMGIKREELIENIEEGGVAAYVDQIGGNANLFI